MPKKPNNNKVIDNKMPIAVPFMILLNSENVVFSDERVKLLAYPLYYDKVEQPNAELTKNFSDEIYSNTGKTAGKAQNNVKIKYRPDVTDMYEEILTMSSEEDYNYDFSALLSYFSHFYGIDTLKTVKTADDVRECYRIILENRSDVSGVKFDRNYCWGIARLFIDDGNKISTFKENEMNKIYAYREEMVNNAKGTVYLAGTTLKDALSIAEDQNGMSLIKPLFENKDIKCINIFILNYVYVALNQEDASLEIQNAINNLLIKVKQPGEKPKIRIVLLSDFDIQFSLLTNESLLARSTHLFTKERCYRGQYLVFNKNSIEYSSLKNFYDFLIEKSYDIDIDSKKDSFYAVKKQFQIGAEGSGKLRKYVELKKIYPIQLENLVRSSFKESSVKSSIDFSTHIHIDNTQEIILPYLQKTELLLDKVVKAHDKSGWAKIVPAPDLGFPNNVTRIAGGFLTGALYDWSCSVPLVPIDTTVNICSSSVFKLNEFNEEITNEQFGKLINEICISCMRDGYSFDFQSGNHFLMVARDDYNNYYLVLHSSASSAKEPHMGLYPNESVWYSQNIKTFYSDDRYLRYIRGDAAVKFIEKTNTFKTLNVDIHKYIASSFAKQFGITVSLDKPVIKHHYDMPTNSSVAIGTFVVQKDADDPNDKIVPIFTDFGKDICLFSVSSNQPRSFTLAGTYGEVVLVPHGWGQAIDGIKKIYLENIKDESERKLRLELENEKKKYEVNSKSRLDFPQKHIREFKDINTFIENCNEYVNGKIEKILHPVFCYCERSFIDKENPKFKFE